MRVEWLTQWVDMASAGSKGTRFQSPQLAAR
jgi:hypothetical protein